MTFVTYRDTAIPLADLAAGRLHIFVSGMAAIRPQVEAGKVKFLAVLGPRRYAGSPETPTVSEAGYPDMMVVGITALFGWKRMATELRDRIAADVKAVADDPDLQARLSTAGLTPRFEPASVLVRLLAEQKVAVSEMLAASAKPR
jgi:tripartite-type tricarboxylate transporter receptor subunit TctC